MSDTRARALQILEEMVQGHRLSSFHFMRGRHGADYGSDRLRLALVLDATIDEARVQKLFGRGWQVLVLSSSQVVLDPDSAGQALLDTALALSDRHG